MRSTLKRRLGRAFTLIELLIVITIIGILAVALVPRISQGPSRARDVTRKTDLGNISTALEIYFSDNGTYPATVSGSPECLTATSAAGALIYPLLNNVMPNDPKADNALTPCTTSNAGYVYNRLTTSSYVLGAKLETTSSVGDNIYCNYTNLSILPTPLCDASSAVDAVRTYFLSR